MFLDAVSLRNPHAISPFRDELSRLLVSPNYMVRNTAHNICERLGLQDALSVSPPPTPLPAVYQILLPPQGFGPFRPLVEASATEPMPDAWDSLDLVRPFDVQLGSVAEEAGLSEENVCYRAAQFMRQQASEEHLSAQYESELRNNLSEIGLRFPFRRPRAALARRAMFRVVAELVDAGRLNDENLRRLDSILRFYDPFMLLVEPVSRPQEIPLMLIDDRSAGRDVTWAERAEETLDMVVTRTDDGHVVLAEETTLKKLDWGSPTEKRCSVVTVSSAPNHSGNDSEPLFYEVVNRLFAEYPNMAIEPAADRPVIRHSAYGYESPGEHWLALNPSIGHRLGWIQDSEGLFKWKNRAGRTMVESVWWADGLLAHTYPLSDEGVGEGWLVLATEEALGQISDTYGSLRRILMAKRKRTGGSEEASQSSRMKENNL